ncbi:MAG: hypothetical protein ACTSXY_12315 [Promethearchaeota archaeon]
MARYREVKKYGNTYVLCFTRSDIHDLNLKVGDLIDIEDAVRNKSVPKELKRIIKK